MNNSNVIKSVLITIKPREVGTKPSAAIRADIPNSILFPVSWDCLTDRKSKCMEV